jgi:hypothetical protein
MESDPDYQGLREGRNCGTAKKQIVVVARENKYRGCGAQFVKLRICEEVHG